MLKSGTNLFQVFAFAAFVLLGCNKEAETSQGAAVKSGVELPAKSEAAPPAAPEPAAPETAASKPAFDIPLEG